MGTLVKIYLDASSRDIQAYRDRLNPGMLAITTALKTNMCNDFRYSGPNTTDTRMVIKWCFLEKNRLFCWVSVSFYGDHVYATA
jgi:hypothetical protein